MTIYLVLSFMRFGLTLISRFPFFNNPSLIDQVERDESGKASFRGSTFNQ